MNEATAVDGVELSEEQAEQQALADMASGYGVKTDPDDKPAVEKVAVEAAPEVPAAEPTDVEKLRADVAALSANLNRQLQQVSGTFGTHKDLIDKATKAAAVAATSAPAKAAEAKKISDDAFKKLADEYPDIAASMREGLETVLAGYAPGGMSQEQVDQIVAARTAEAVKAAREEITSGVAKQVGDLQEKLVKVELTASHPTWKAETASKEFGNWFQKQPPQYQHELYASWDATTVGAAIDKFRVETKAVRVAADTRQSRLKLAAGPVGKGGTGEPSAMTEQQQLEYGYKHPSG